MNKLQIYCELILGGFVSFSTTIFITVMLISQEVPFFPSYGEKTFYYLAILILAVILFPLIPISLGIVIKAYKKLKSINH